SGEQRFVKRQSDAIHASAFFQLRKQRHGINTDAHAGDLYGLIDHWIIDQDIAVERPVIIIRRAAIMRDAAFQLIADLHDTGAAMCLSKFIFALFRRQMRILILKFLRSDERDLFFDDWFKILKYLAQLLLCLLQRLHDLFHRLLQMLERAVFRADDLLPVPLIDIDRVQIVDDLISADGIHISIDAFIYLEAIAFERHALPFGQRVHDLHITFDITDIKGDRTLYAIEVIIETAVFADKQRRGYTHQVQMIRQPAFKQILHIFDGNLRRDVIQFVFIIMREDQSSFVHGFSPFFLHTMAPI